MGFWPYPNNGQLGEEYLFQEFSLSFSEKEISLKEIVVSHTDANRKTTDNWAPAGRFTLLKITVSGSLIPFLMCMLKAFNARRLKSTHGSVKLIVSHLHTTWLEQVCMVSFTHSIQKSMWPVCGIFQGPSRASKSRSKKYDVFIWRNIIAFMICGLKSKETLSNQCTCFPSYVIRDNLFIAFQMRWSRWQVGLSYLKYRLNRCI